MNPLYVPADPYCKVFLITSASLRTDAPEPSIVLARDETGLSRRETGSFVSPGPRRRASSSADRGTSDG
jgi:hypothetical protein